MHKKALFFWSIIVLLLIVPLAGGDDNGTYKKDDPNIIILKAGTIRTDIDPAAYENQTSEIPEPSVASYSIATAESDNNPYSYHIVQFKGPVLEEWKEEVAGTGAALFDYIPNNAFVVRMDSVQREQVRSLEFVKWVGEYRASYKHGLETKNTDQPASSSEDADIIVEIIVLLFDGSEKQKISEDILSMGADIVESSDSTLRVRISKDKISDLAAIEGVRWMEAYKQPVVFNDVAAGIINVDQAHTDYKLNGTGQIVAVCDTGLDTGVNDNTMHADIRGRVLAIFDLAGDGAEDQTSHGTHVTASVLGNGAMSGGKYKGIAPEALLVFQAAGTDAGLLTGVPSDLNLLFQQAYDKNARIHTNSWGYPYDSGNYSRDSWNVDTFIWNHPDTLILFSAGNYGTDVDNNGVVDRNSITPPATAKNVLTVGASESYRPNLTKTYGFQWPFYVNPLYSDHTSKSPEGIAAFSGRGPTDDGRIKPDLVAPGTSIASIRSSISTFTGWEKVEDNANYVYMSGTSMSTPIVAGAAALTRQYYTDIEGLPDPSAALLKATLINGAHDMSPGQYGTGSTQEITGRPDSSQGWGRVDIENSLFPEYPQVVAYYDNKAGLGTSGSWSTEYSYIKEREPIRATLVWTDYPGAPASSRALVNDLDLIVTGTGGTYHVNGKGVPDTINNVETVDIESASAGNYRFGVTGRNVPQGPQDFALVLSFTCKNNLFPAQGSSTSDTATRVSTDVVHPGGVDKNSIRMYINGVPASITSVVVPGGYKVQYDAPASYQEGRYNVSVTALTTKGQAFSYEWDFNVKPVVKSFTFGKLNPAVSGVINEDAKTITLTVPYGTDLQSLEPEIVHNAASISPSSGAAQDFTRPVAYTVKAADGSTQIYTVTVNTAPGSAKSITGFIFNSFSPAVIGNIDEPSKTISLTVPPGTDTASLVPTIEHTGISVSPGTGVAQDFTQTGSYTVTAADGTTQQYTVTVTVAASPVTSIKSFRFMQLDPTVTGIIDERSKTVILTVPNGTNVTALVPSIEHTGESIFPDSEVAQNFTGPVSYAVTSADGATQKYTVVVNIAANTDTSPSPTSSSRSGGGGGGGGGGSTGEKIANIALKDVTSIFVRKDLTRFDFKDPGNDIQYIEYTSLKNSGTITALIEVLKDRSVLAGSSPEGIVYRHINIWLGKAGYATEANIMGPSIGFRVDRKWIASHSIDPDSVVLNRYSGAAWEELATERTGSDENYLYYTAETPGFSLFAITGESLQDETTLHSTSEILSSTSSGENGSNSSESSIGSDGSETQAQRTLPALPAAITLLIVSFVCFLVRKH